LTGPEIPVGLNQPVDHLLASRLAPLNSSSKLRFQLPGSPTGPADGLVANGDPGNWGARGTAVVDVAAGVVAAAVTLDTAIGAAAPVGPPAPVGPSAPVAPAGAAGALTPAGAAGPATPAGAAGPATPARPVGPLGPLEPLEPLEPVAPLPPLTVCGPDPTPAAPSVWLTFRIDTASRGVNVRALAVTVRLRPLTANVTLIFARRPSPTLRALRRTRPISTRTGPPARRPPLIVTATS
jgi:hypothetical protein